MRPEPMYAFFVTQSFWVVSALSPAAGKHGPSARTLIGRGCAKGIAQHREGSPVLSDWANAAQWMGSVQPMWTQAIGHGFHGIRFCGCGKIPRCPNSVGSEPERAIIPGSAVEEFRFGGLKSTIQSRAMYDLGLRSLLHPSTHQHRPLVHSIPLTSWLAL